uniref:Transmembrane protein 241 n=1 Tax=Buteo japonicus TaxID=224669 RepID=A0A8C0AMF3_9AVES
MQHNDVIVDDTSLCACYTKCSGWTNDSEMLFCFYFRWQTLVGGLLLHVSWKLGWVEINLCSRSEILSWLPASVLFVGIIYAGSRALSRLPIPVFLTVHNAAEVITCGFQKFVQKEVIDIVLFLLVAAVCLPLCDTQFDPNGYLWALIHLICVGNKCVGEISFIMKLLWVISPPCVPLSILLCPSGDLFSALDFPFLYFYRFHSSCCASGLLGFFLMLHTVKLKSSTTSGQYAAWSFLAKVRERLSQEHSESVLLPGELRNFCIPLVSLGPGQAGGMGQQKSWKSQQGQM